MRDSRRTRGRGRTARTGGEDGYDEPHCRKCGLWRDRNQPIPRGWTVHRDIQADELYVVCSDECRIELGLPERREGPCLDDLFGDGSPERRSILVPGPDLDDLF